MNQVAIISFLRTNSVSQGFVLSGLTMVGLIGGLITKNPAFFILSFLAGGLPSAYSASIKLFKKGKLDVDLLMVLAAIGAITVGHPEDGIILLFLFSLSNALQRWAMDRTKNAIRALMKLNPEGATVRRNGQEVWIPLNEVQKDDILIIKPGERFASDGKLIKGSTSIDESAITGESVPVDKSEGDLVASGTLNGQGVVEVLVTRTANESTLAKLIKLVELARTNKSVSESFANLFEGKYTIGVLLATLILFGIFVAVGLDVDSAWYRAMTFLVVASPCAVVISTPAAILSAMAAGARFGTLFKSGLAVELLGKVKILAFDKTGTLTEGKMQLAEIVPITGTKEEVLALAAALERHSEHPIAKAISSASQAKISIDDVQAERGKGIKGKLNGQTVWAGTRLLAQEMAASTEKIENELVKLEQNGLTTVILGRENQIIALFAVADKPRLEAAFALKDLHKRGFTVAMLTGDRKAVANHIANQLGIDLVEAELLPENKLEVIAQLRQTGLVAMVGDGVNDAPALTAADLGISMGSGTDVALESADVVLMKNNFSSLVRAIDLAKETNKTIRFNLTFALGIIFCVGLASIFGLVPLPWGVVAHEGGTVFVVLMGLRLLFFKNKASIRN